MKLQRFAIGPVLAWMFAMPFTPHAPTTALELRTYRKVSSTELADVRNRALHLAATGSGLASGSSGDEFFELMVRGTPAVLVDNSTTRLLIASVSIGPRLRRGTYRRCGSREPHLGNRGNGDERGPTIRSKSVPAGAGGSRAPPGSSGH